MKNELVKKYFQLISMAMYATGVLPGEIKLKTKLGTYLFNRWWPRVFLLIWIPLVPMVTIKVYQFFKNSEWEELMDTMHMYIFGCNTLYVMYAIQRTPMLYKTIMNDVIEKFGSCDDITLQDFNLIIVLFIALCCSFSSYTAVSLYYAEVMVPVWIPFVDDGQLHSPLIVGFVLVYEILCGIVMVTVYGVLSPFVILVTSIIIKELNYLIETLQDLKFHHFESNKSSVGITFWRDIFCTFPRALGINGLHSFKTLITDTNNLENSKCRDTNTYIISESDGKEFIRRFVAHHQMIKRVIAEVSSIHFNIFLTQAIITVTQSCFVAFNMYYTKRLNKVIAKSTPAFFLSYYMLYIYCWNGQRLTDTCERLFRALYECEWYNFPQSFKTSLLTLMGFCIKPVRFTGGGIFQARFDTFLTALQQSFTYILLLKQLTPDKKM